MLNEKIIAEALLTCQQKLEAIDQVAALVNGWRDSLQKEINVLRDLAQAYGAEAAYEQQYKDVQLQFPGMNVAADLYLKTRKRKPDVQILEEIFAVYGPLHVADVVKLGQEQGITFSGSKKPTAMARDKLNASKRFHLFGNNVWGLPSQEVQDDLANGVSLLQDQNPRIPDKGLLPIQKSPVERDTE